MKNTNLLKIISLAALVGLASCQQNLTRTDGVTTHAGDALAINEAKSVVDPWPRNVENTHIEGDGQRLGDAVIKYKTANKPGSSGQAQSNSIPQLGAPSNAASAQ